MTIRVKICGINDPVAFDTAVAAGADWVGFNFFPPSPRHVTPQQAAALSERTTAAVSRVGLFVDPTVEAVAAALETVQLDALQVYGEVDVPALRRKFGVPIWRPVGVASGGDLPDTSSGADRLLLEAKPPVGATRPGGNATRFDWSLLHDWRAPVPWILAGGLTVGNVAEAIRTTGAQAVDVSSGVERERGVKDPRMIRAFIRNARAAGIRLRHAGPADAEALAQVHVQAWREAYVGQLPDAVLQGLDLAKRAAMWRDAMGQTAQVQLAIQNGNIVGFGASRPQSDAALPFAGEISAIYVLRCAQRLGTGRRLMAAMAQDLLARSLPSASLWVLETNTPARRFYAELGGVEVARQARAREGHSAVSVAYGWDDVRILI